MPVAIHGRARRLEQGPGQALVRDGCPGPGRALSSRNAGAGRRLEHVLRPASPTRRWRQRPGRLRFSDWTARVLCRQRWTERLSAGARRIRSRSLALAPHHPSASRRRGAAPGNNHGCPATPQPDWRGERCGMRVAAYRRHEGPAAACAAATKAPSASSSAGAHAACIRSKSPRSSLWMWALSR